MYKQNVIKARREKIHQRQTPNSISAFAAIFSPANLIQFVSIDNCESELCLNFSEIVKEALACRLLALQS